MSVDNVYYAIDTKDPEISEICYSSNVIEETDTIELIGVSNNPNIRMAMAVLLKDTLVLKKFTIRNLDS